MNIETVKKWKRVDFDDDDDLIELIISATEEYITEAVGVYDSTSPLMELLALTICADLYEKRTYTISAADKQKYLGLSAMRQLQLKYEEYDDDD